MKLFFQKINQFLSGFCGWLMIGMMLLLVADIIARSINKPLQGMAELSVFVMMIVIYFGLARCEQHREHVGLELVVNALPDRLKKAVVVITHLMAVFTVGLLFFAVSQNALVSFQKQRINWWNNGASYLAGKISDGRRFVFFPDSDHCQSGRSDKERKEQRENGAPPIRDTSSISR